ncbi:MAG: polyphosphate kinase 2 family protein [Polyangiales bacterium]|nr:polyphosphate kinase 2 family protein [Myxococcales bacterium]
MPSKFWKPVESPYLVPFDGAFAVKKARTSATKQVDAKDAEAELSELAHRTEKLQRKLYAADRFAVLMVFQAMDCAGKDSTIRAVTRGLNPAACDVTAFKAPTHLELEHDFLWRSVRRLPERGRIGVHNRSHYEEVLAVRVHPEFLEGQRVPMPKRLDRLFEQRIRSIRDAERHWARNGLVILKFWLNVSREEQARRLVARIDEHQNNWKFDPRDVVERGHWDAYMKAYEAALNGTSRKWAPWYAIPADDKPTMRVEIARILNATMASLDMEYPKLPPEELAKMAELRKGLVDGSL